MGASAEAIKKALAVRKLSRERLAAPPPRSFLELSEINAEE
jgi:hypothetical protein